MRRGRAYRRRECLGSSQRFDEHRNRSNAFVARDILEIVRNVAYRFVSDGDNVTEPNVAWILAQRHCDGTALRDYGERSRPDFGKIGYPERGQRRITEYSENLVVAWVHREDVPS